MLDEEAEKEKQLERQEKKRYRPYKFSGKSYTFDVASEKQIVDNLRYWGRDYFASNHVITKDMYKSLREAKEMQESKEFDLLCKVIKIFEKDEHNLELRIKDMSQE
jgi:hypothetical protein